MKDIRTSPTPEDRARLLAKKAFICDMDGVIYHGNKLLPGVIEFTEWLERKGKQYLFLTNSGERTPRELSEKLRRLGINIHESHFYTSALATAQIDERRMRELYEAGLAPRRDYEQAMIRIQDILDKVEKYQTREDVELVRKAYVYAAAAHAGLPCTSPRSASCRQPSKRFAPGCHREKSPSRRKRSA